MNSHELHMLGRELETAIEIIHKETQLNTIATKPRQPVRHQILVKCKKKKTEEEKH